MAKSDKMRATLVVSVIWALCAISATHARPQTDLGTQPPSSNAASPSAGALTTSSSAVSTTTTVAAPRCLCSPECAKNMTAADCPDGRVTSRPDCPCCVVCAGQRGATCDVSIKPCDSDFGLVCSDAGICHAAHNCTADSNCSSSEFCHGGVCVDPCKVLNPCDRSLRNGVCVANGHRAVCQCPLGFVNFGLECKPVKCTHQGMEYSYADSVYESSCQQKCTCSASGEMTCSKEYACAPGFFRRGTYAKDPLCYEDGDAPFADQCCVTVLCSSAKGKVQETPGGAGSTTTTEKASSPKADEVTPSPAPSVEEVVEVELKLVNESTSAIKSTEEEAVSSSTVSSTTVAATTEAPASPATPAPSEQSTSGSTSTSTSSSTTSMVIPTLAGEATSLKPISAAEAPPADDFPSSVLEILNISHNQTTLRLPDTLGGVLYLVARDKYVGNSTRWDTLSIPAGAHSYTVMHLRPGTEYLMRWNTPDSMTPVASFRTQDGCVVEVEGVSYGTGERYAVGCVSQCRCLANGKVDCTQRCRRNKGQLELGPNCQEVPDPADPECCVIQQCTPSSSTAAPRVETPPPPPSTSPPPPVEPTTEEEKVEPSRDIDRLPNLLVTEATFQSFTVVWDEFRPRSHTQGYLVQYRRAPEAGSSTVIPWHDIQVGGDRPLVKVGGLLPNTDYEVKVSIAGDSHPPVSTATIRVKTKMGCMQNGTSYEVGAEVRIGCEKLCRCLENGSMTCTPRCMAPFVPRGSASDVGGDCQERPDGSDDGCCVIVSCIQPPAGSNPIIATDVPAGDDMCKAGNATYKVGDEFFDGCESKCSCSASFQIECQPRCAVRAHTSALPPGCTVATDPKDSCCSIIMCESGVGSGIISRDNAKPSAPTLPFEGCVYKNKTYQKLERFYDGCERHCQCIGFDDISCLPRCPPFQNITGRPDCDILPDPVDPCCKVTVCGASTDVNRTTPLAGDINRDETPQNPSPAEITERSGAEFTSRTTPIGSVVGLYSTTSSSTTSTSTTTFPLAAGRVDLMSVTILDPTTLRLEVDLSESVLRALEEGPELLILHYGTDLVRFRQKPIPWTEVRRNGSFVEIRLVDLTPGVQYFFQLEFRGIRSSTATASAPQDTRTSMDNTSPRAETLTTAMPVAESRSSTIDPVEPTSRGSTRVVAGCDHEGVTHPVGAEFFKGCDYRCHCVGPSLPHCVPRCWKQSVPAPGSNCTVGKDPLDDCCTVVQCFGNIPPPAQLAIEPQDEILSRSALGVDILAAPTEPPNGCFHNGILLDVGANYTKGCQTCICLGPGIEHCAPRCQYTAESLVPEPGCALIPIPNDSCCFELKCPEKRPRLQTDDNEEKQGVGRGCWQNGKWLPVYKRVYDECKSFCMCSPSGKMECVSVECPDTFALEYIHHECFEWGPSPNITVEPPDCCPEYVCINDGTCEYKGRKFNNFEVIPTELTGCDQKCECEFGSVTCTRMCPLISATPPSSLPCPPHAAQLVVSPENKCCKLWKCPPTTTTTTTTTVATPPSSSPIHLTSNKIDIFEPSCTYEGKEYRTAEEWTEGPNCRLKRCKCILDPDGIARARCEGGCAEISERQLWPSARCPHPHLIESDDPCICPSVACGPPIEVTPSSTSTTTTTTTTTIRTTTTTELPRSVEISANLEAVSVEPTRATIKWRKFADNETQYIDGIQVRYRNAMENSQVWKMTPLLHRDRADYELRSLEPDAEYHVVLSFIPLPRQSVDLYSNETLHFHTPPLTDEYDFSIVVSLGNVTAQEIVVRWSGAPYPPEKYVNVYQVVFQPPGQLEPSSKLFVLPQDKPSATISGLKPRTPYHVWVRAYLRNGKVRGSNVIEVITSGEVEVIRDVPNELESKGQTFIQNEAGNLQTTTGDKATEAGNYFGAMVGVLVVLVIIIVVLGGAITYLCWRKKGKALQITDGKPAPTNGASHTSQITVPYSNPSFKNHSDNESHEMTNGRENGNSRDHVSRVRVGNS